MAEGPDIAPEIAVVLKGYPRLSETFIAQEILGLEARGAKLTIVSLRHPTDRDVHPVHTQIAAPVVYLPEYLHREPGRVLRGVWRSRRRPAFRRALKVWLKDLAGDFSRNRFRRFGQALVLAAELPATVRHLHAHFLHTPASVAQYAATLLELPWSASAHAKDIWTTPRTELARKLGDAAWVVTCTMANRTYLNGIRPDGAGEVDLVYHGFDTNRFPAPAPRRESAGIVRLLSVGRCVPKKGYPVLLEALAQLPDNLAWTFEHIGGGPEAARLHAQAGALGLSEQIVWHGAKPQADVVAAYRRADIFVLPCVVTDDGDRDGLPNVLLEAQSQGVACVSTGISGIPELIDDGETGILAAPGNSASLAAALEELIRDPDLRRRLGDAGQRRVARDFGAEGGFDAIAGKLGIRPAAPARKAEAA